MTVVMGVHNAMQRAEAEMYICRKLCKYQANTCKKDSLRR